jgi:hypothetical protein
MYKHSAPKSFSNESMLRAEWSGVEQYRYSTSPPHLEPAYQQPSSPIVVLLLNLPLIIAPFRSVSIPLILCLSANEYPPDLSIGRIDTLE